MNINQNYIQVQGWMVKQLNLSGNELLTYALIYGFSQDGESLFKGSLKYICEWLNCSRPTAIKSIKSLIKKGLVIKQVDNISNVKFNRYKALLPTDDEFLGVVKNLNTGGKETLLAGGKESLPNNNSNDSIEDTTKKNKRKKVGDENELEAYSNSRSSSEELFSAKASNCESQGSLFEEEEKKGKDKKPSKKSAREVDFENEEAEIENKWNELIELWQEHAIKIGKDEFGNMKGVTFKRFKYIHQKNYVEVLNELLSSIKDKKMLLDTKGIESWHRKLKNVIYKKASTKNYLEFHEEQMRNYKLDKIKAQKAKDEIEPPLNGRYSEQYYNEEVKGKFHEGIYKSILDYEEVQDTPEFRKEVKIHFEKDFEDFMQESNLKNPYSNWYAKKTNEEKKQ